MSRASESYEQADPHFLKIETDAFVGRRHTVERYLIASLAGYFPVVVRVGDTKLAAVFRTGAPHVGISGTISVSTSDDGGQSWTDSVRVTPRWEDARNPALGVTDTGRLVVAYWTAVRHAYLADENGYKWNPKDAAEIQDVPGLAIRTSDDGGSAWSPPKFFHSSGLLFASPYGRIVQTAPNELMLPVYGRTRGGAEDEFSCALLRSSDDGAQWGDETVIANDQDETAILPLGDGRLIAAARSHSMRNISTFESSDNGYNWEPLSEITRRDEHPADLTYLDSGSILLTYGRRIRPFGCGALLSRDGGLSWDRNREAILAGDGAGSSDLGYPSTVQLADGTICTALYFGSGSQASDDEGSSWGDISCQMLRYRESLLD